MGFNLPTAKIVNAFQAGDVNRKAATVMTETELVKEEVEPLPLGLSRCD
jgi:hypothetical protein